MIKFLHLIGGTTFFGLVIASFFYIACSIQKGDRSLIHYSLKASYFGDAVIFIIIILQLMTSVKLIARENLTLEVPWIFVAFHAFGIVIVLWLSIFFLKCLFFSKSAISTFVLTIFYLLNVIIILLFIVIIHDAVTQSTWFDFLFRK